VAKPRTIFASSEFPPIARGAGGFVGPVSNSRFQYQIQGFEIFTLSTTFRMPENFLEELRETRECVLFFGWLLMCSKIMGRVGRAKAFD